MRTARRTLGVSQLGDDVMLWQQFFSDDRGQDLVEYALIVAAVGLALITTVNQLSQGIVSLYQSITGDLSSIGAQQ